MSAVVASHLHKSRSEAGEFARNRESSQCHGMIRALTSGIARASDAGIVTYPHSRLPRPELDGSAKQQLRPLAVNRGRFGNVRSFLRLHFYPQMDTGLYIVVTSALTLLPAVLSWHLMEKKALALKPRTRAPSINPA